MNPTEPQPLHPHTVYRFVALDSPGEVALTDRYVDRYWMPVAGPTVIALARFVAIEATRGAEWSGGDVARYIGAGESMKRLARALERAHRFRFMTWRGGHEMVARMHVPAIHRRHYRLMPNALVAELEPVPPNDGEQCSVCGAVRPPGGLAVTPDLDGWACRRVGACVRRAGQTAPSLDSYDPRRRAAAIDADYARRTR